MTLKHRNQTVDVIQGVAFINDSKATNVDATRHALKIYKNVHLILGGQAKENNFDQSKEERDIELENVKNEAQSKIESLKDDNQVKILVSENDKLLSSDFKKLTKK